jgi:hypothetical protein
MWKDTLSNPKVLGIVVLGSGVVGSALGYLVASKKLSVKYAEISKIEIAEAKAYYERTIKPSSPEELAEAYIEQGGEEVEASILQLRSIVTTYQGEAEETTSESEEVPVNVFAERDTFDYGEELPLRTEDKPYIISHDEFMGAEKGYDQNSLTYYEGDDVLADEREAPIEDVDGTVGNANLLKFGHGSRDNNIVYVRNDHLELEFEIARDQGRYSEKVLGFIEPEPRSVRRDRRE